MTEPMLILVNGLEQRLADSSVTSLLAAQGVATDARGIAVARNGAVVPRRLWPETRLEAGDRIEIIKAVSGG
jgi:sulfur carrier protein